MADINVKNISVSIIHLFVALSTVVTVTIYFARIDAGMSYVKKKMDEDHASFSDTQKANDLRMQKLEIDVSDLRVRISVLESKVQKMQDEK